MNPLDIDAINTQSPYPVWNKGGEYLFKTDNEIEYSVSFDEEDNFEYKSYWFNLTNISHEKSPGDVKIAKTVICIIEEFFSQNPDILLYLCSTYGGQQAQRSRLFLRWFKGYEQQKKYTIKSAEVKGDDLMEYIRYFLSKTVSNLDDFPTMERKIMRNLKADAYCYITHVKYDYELKERSAA